MADCNLSDDEKVLQNNLNRITNELDNSVVFDSDCDDGDGIYEEIKYNCNMILELQQQLQQLQQQQKKEAAEIMEMI